MYYFILNPAAGNGRSIKIMQRIREIMDKKSTKYKVVETEYPGHATLIAKDAVKNGIKRIIAVGGDGTVLEVANGMIGEEAAMASYRPAQATILLKRSASQMILKSLWKYF